MVRLRSRRVCESRPQRAVRDHARGDARVLAALDWLLRTMRQDERLYLQARRGAIPHRLPRARRVWSPKRMGAVAHVLRMAGGVRRIRYPRWRKRLGDPGATRVPQVGWTVLPRHGNQPAPQRIQEDVPDSPSTSEVHTGLRRGGRKRNLGRTSRLVGPSCAGGSASVVSDRTVGAAGDIYGPPANTNTRTDPERHMGCRPAAAR